MKMEEMKNIVVRISILISKEDKEKLLELCKQFDTDLSKFMRKLIKKVIR